MIEEVKQLRPGERVKLFTNVKGTVTLNTMGSIIVKWDDGDCIAYKYDECVYITSLVFKPERI